MMPEDTKRSRRAVLAAAAGAAAATAVGAIARPAAVLAAGDDGATVHIGDQLRDVRSTTLLKNVSNGNTVLFAKSADEGGGGSAGTGSPIVAISDTGIGIWAESTTRALVGMGHTGTAIVGASTFSVDPPASRPYTGVYGYSDHDDGVGVYGSAVSTSGRTAGVYGRADSRAGYGVYGVAGSTAPAVVGYSGSGTPSPAPANTAILGVSEQGRGGVFRSGAMAQVRLAPSTELTHPASGKRGDLFVDKSGRLWFCKGGTTWKQLA